MSPDDIKSLRKSRGWSARQLADALGVDTKLVQAWESGDQFPTRKAIERLTMLVQQAPAALSPWAALRDPALWTLVRKVVAHRELRDKVAKLADSYPDPDDAGPRG